MNRKEYTQTHRLLSPLPRPLSPKPLIQPLQEPTHFLLIRINPTPHRQIPLSLSPTLRLLLSLLLLLPHLRLLRQLRVRLHLRRCRHITLLMQIALIPARGRLLRLVLVLAVSGGGGLLARRAWQTGRGDRAGAEGRGRLTLVLGLSLVGRELRCAWWAAGEEGGLAVEVCLVGGRGSWWGGEAGVVGLLLL